MRARPADFSDFADFGTAFGLDLSLEPVAEPALPARPAGRGHAWWRRLGARRDVAR